jgi:hypothetical protein
LSEQAEELELHELMQPTALDGGSAPSIPEHLALKPEKLIWLYEDSEWEEFVLEWATRLHDRYHKVRRSGGSNDHGVDVVGFATDQGFEGEWDCFQCKMYGSAITAKTAFPEIVKVVLSTMAGHYAWPRLYRFAAPKGIGQGLANIIDTPSLLKAAVVKELTKDKSVLVRQIGDVPLADVLAAIDDADFSIFGALEIHELIADHSVTKWHSVRFGVSLPPRPAAPNPSTAPSANEQRYIEKLMDVYNEHSSDLPCSPANVHTWPVTRSRHYERQRVAFYSAEALRVFARDAVPEGTFEALQDEIYDAVIETHDREFDCGMDRLYAVTETARAAPLAANGLVPVVYMRDRTGICHQLSNNDRLEWVV